MTTRTDCIQPSRIGISNIFQSMCKLNTPDIKNRNVFGSAIPVRIGSNDLFIVDTEQDVDL